MNAGIFTCFASKRLETLMLCFTVAESVVSRDNGAAMTAEARALAASIREMILTGNFDDADGEWEVVSDDGDP